GARAPPPLFFSGCSPPSWLFRVTNPTPPPWAPPGSRFKIVTISEPQPPRRYKDKTYTNYLLVESIHTPKGPRQKVICSLGDLSPRPAEDWLRLARKVEDALVGQAHLFSNPDPEVEQIVRRVQNRQARTTPPLARSSPPPGPRRSRLGPHRLPRHDQATLGWPPPRRLPVLETVGARGHPPPPGLLHPGH